MSINKRADGLVGELYARTLFDISTERQNAETVKSDLGAVQDIFAGESDFWRLMCSPYFTTQQKAALLQKVFSERLSELTMNFLMVTLRHNRIKFLRDINDCFVKLWDRRHGSLPVKVTVSRKMDDSLEQKLSDELASVLNWKVNMEVTVNPSIIGGIIIRYDDKVVDNTVRTRLCSLITAITSVEKRWIKQDEIRFE